MEKNDLISLIAKLSKAALSAPQNNTKEEETKSRSFKEQTSKKPEPERVDRSKPKKPSHSSDAIIKMIQEHNALRHKICEQNNNK